MKRLILITALAACSQKLPDTRYYQLAAPTKSAPHGNPVLVLEPFETDTAYDDERIVYRTNPYRIDYYQYHRWSSSPGVLVGNFLEQAFERSGRFRAVVREATTDAAVSLRGRVVAIEEVDRSTTHWEARVVLELAVTDARTGEVLWQDQFEEHEPMPQQHPEGLARALSTAMARITTKATPIIGDLADRRAAANATAAPTTSARRSR